MGNVAGKKILTVAISLLAVLALLLQPCAAARPVPGTATIIDGSQSLHLPPRLHGYFTDLPYPYPDTYPILRYPDTPSIPYRQSIGKYEEKNK